MAELNFKKLADAPILEKVPDGAKVYAEVDGKVYRVAGDNLGGGVKTAIIRVDMSSVDGTSLMTLAAGDGERSSASQKYPCTVENMTFEEAEAILTAGKPLNAVVLQSVSEYEISSLALGVGYVNAEQLIRLYGEFLAVNEIAWDSSGCTATVNK